MKTEPNESAFGFEGETELQRGLTKREYFAGLAMQGLIMSNDDGAGDRLTEVPRYACDIANALIAALNSEKAE